MTGLLLAGNGKRRVRGGNNRDKRPISRPASYGRVLMFGKNRELALYRAAVLDQSGYRVIVPNTRQEAIDVITHGDLDVAILSYTLAGDTVEELAELVRQHCPDTAIITIAQEGREDRRIDPDATVLADDGPAALLAALRRVRKHHLQ